jgi:hypothetical protein
MTHPSTEPPTSVTGLVAELTRVRAVIRRARKPTLPAGDQATAADLLGLYARERAIVRRLRRRHRQWRADTRISDAAPSQTGTMHTSGLT